MVSDEVRVGARPGLYTFCRREPDDLPELADVLWVLSDSEAMLRKGGLLGDVGVPGPG